MLCTATAIDSSDRTMSISTFSELWKLRGGLWKKPERKAGASASSIYASIRRVVLSLLICLDSLSLCCYLLRSGIVSGVVGKLLHLERRDAVGAQLVANLGVNVAVVAVRVNHKALLVHDALDEHANTLITRVSGDVLLRQHCLRNAVLVARAALDEDH